MSLLYEDQYVKITDEGVEIKWYYFPTAQSKFIAFSDVKCFRLESKNLFTSKGESCVPPPPPPPPASLSLFLSPPSPPRRVRGRGWERDDGEDAPEAFLARDPP